jgi:hypothetical protein
MTHEDTYHILCGYEKPAIMSCGGDDLAGWLEAATKDGQPIVHDFGDWMEKPGSVIVIRGHVVGSDDLPMNGTQLEIELDP